MAYEVITQRHLPGVKLKARVPSYTRVGRKLSMLLNFELGPALDPPAVLQVPVVQPQVTSTDKPVLYAM